MLTHEEIMLRVYRLGRTVGASQETLEVCANGGDRDNLCRIEVRDDAYHSVAMEGDAGQERFVAGPPSPFDRPLTLGAGYEYQPPADFDDGGEVQTKKAHIDAAWSLFSASYAVRDFSWDDTASLSMAPGADTPVKTLHKISLGARYFDSFSRDWGWFGGGGVASAFEDEMDDSYSANLRTGVDWRMASRWNLQLGAMVKTGPYKTSAFPILRLNYDGVEEKVGSGLFATLSYPESSLGYQFDPTFSLVGRLGKESDTYRLADDSAIQREGYLTIEDHYFDLVAKWNIAERWQIDVGPRILFSRTWEVRDSDGDDETDYDLDAGLAGFASVKYEF